MTTADAAGLSPAWLLVLGLGTPALAFLGAVTGHRVTRRGLLDLDRWRKREETMRMLRWAVELAVERDPRRAEAGLSVLYALLDSPLLDDDDIDMVSEVATSVAEGHLQE